MRFKWRARHSVLSVLFVVWVVSFMDRMVMSVAIPYIAIDFGLSPIAMGAVMSAFFLAYSIAQVPGGMLADRFGVRKVATVAMIWWSLFTAITGTVVNMTQMLVARFIFGIGEGIFPACAFKTIAVWFPQKERATANALMLSSNSLGPAITPLFVVAIMSFWSWQTVFYCLFLPGIVISLLFWFLVPDKPAESKRVSKEELAEIEGGDKISVESSGRKLGIRDLFRERSVLICFLILLTFDITLWGFQTWLPTYLVKARGFSMVKMGIVASLPFFAGMIGCILGGYISDRFFANNRRVPIIATQLLAALFLYLTVTTDSTDMLIAYLILGGACIKFFISAFWALPMNIIPKALMGTASGFINMAGQIAAFLSPLIIGFLVEASGGKFDTTFAFLIGASLLSCGIVFTLPRKTQQTEPAS
jgi:sugar phosphate permease